MHTRLPGTPNCANHHVFQVAKAESMGLSPLPNHAALPHAGKNKNKPAPVEQATRPGM